MGDALPLLLVIFIGLFVVVLYRWDRKIKKAAFKAAKKDFEHELRNNEEEFNRVLKQPKSKS